MPANASISQRNETTVKVQRKDSFRSQKSVNLEIKAKKKRVGDDVVEFGLSTVAGPIVLLNTSDTVLGLSLSAPSN